MVDYRKTAEKNSRSRQRSAFDLPRPNAGNRENKRKQNLPTPTSHIFALLFFILGVLITVILVEKRLPPPLRLSDVRMHPERFIAERAMNNLINLTNIGPRITGTYENEVLAVNFFLNEIDNIIKASKDIHIIEVDVQKSSGAFQLAFLDGLTNVYRNVQSVIVKMGSRINSNHSLLINCHFDTVADSPGGSDDGAGCAVMLEMLRVLSSSDKLLKHNIIFLFNGAEENLMQASHGFITQHKWAKEVRAFINLEACGAGGRELLFQAGPNSPWIMQTYSQSVPYPHASSLAQDIFQSGIIPGDTDFRIFRDFGHVSGLDFAWNTNGYVYHTKFDTVQQIPMGSLQRTGDNILALAKGMANGHQLSDISANSDEGLVFFDFLGAFVVRWPILIADVINISALLITAYSIHKNMKDAAKQGVPRFLYYRNLGIAVGVVFLTWVASFIFNIGVAVTLSAFERQMSWFARPLWLFFLYIIPTLLVPMLGFLFAAKKQRKVIESPWVLFQLYYDAVHLIWAFLLLVTIILQVRSGFITLLWVVFAAFGNFIRSFLFRHYRDWKWLLLHTATFALPFVQTFYLIIAALYMFIPIMGRVGAALPAEIVISAMTSLQFNMLFSFLTILIFLCKTPERVISILAGIFFIAMALLLLTPLGFPYSGDSNSPAPQRYMIFHTERKFHDASGNIKKHDSGYWFVDMDVNSPKAILQHVPEMYNAVYSPEDCTKELFCGYPYLLPVSKFLWVTHWLPAPKPNVPIFASLILNERRLVGDGAWRLNFTATGPVHMGLMLSPKSGVLLDRWSLDENIPLKGEPFNGRDTYFVYYGCASEPAPWNFHIDFKPLNNSVFDAKDLLVDLAITGHFLRGPHKGDDKFKEFISRFPSWTTVTSWTSTYQSYVF